MWNAIVIDDEIVVAEAIKRRVNWEKYNVSRVFMAHSIEQAKKIFQTEIINFMLCDIEMPQGNGLELFEWVKTYYPAVECVYITCHPEYEYIRKALKLGSADYILKPVNYEELDEILVQLVERLQNTKRQEEIPESIIVRIAKKKSEENQSQPIHSAKEYILRHIQETIYIEDIAKAVFLNEQYLMHLFKKETGVSILEYITKERITLAKELLVSTSYRVNEVADTVGYGKYSYFTRIFKRSTGMTPIEYRQKMKDMQKKE